MNRFLKCGWLNRYSSSVSLIWCLGLFLSFAGLTACGGESEYKRPVSDYELRQRCYYCQDKCFRDYQRVMGDDINKWQPKWQKCLVKCVKKYKLDPKLCQSIDKDIKNPRAKRYKKKKKDD